jgi:Adenosine deaminase
MLVAQHPPHRSVLALLTHTVPTSDIGPDCRVVLREACLTHTVQPAGPASPARPPVRVRRFHVLLGQRPSLHDLLRPSPAFVRSLRRYYEAGVPIILNTDDPALFGCTLLRQYSLAEQTFGLPIEPLAANAFRYAFTAPTHGRDLGR